MRNWVRRETKLRAIYRKPQEGWKEKLAKIKIGRNSHSIGRDILDNWLPQKTSHELCIMEAIDYIQGGGAYNGGGQVTDAPVCVSDVMRDFLIEVNDNWIGEVGDRRRRQLKELIPLVIGTAPVDRDGIPITTAVYERREEKRRVLLEEFRRKQRRNAWGTMLWQETTFGPVKKLVEEMVAVK